MGSSPEGLLLYGVRLFDGDSWDVEQVDEYGGLKVDWIDPDDDDDHAEVLERRLLASVGFDEVYPGPDGDGSAHFDRRREAEARLGLELEFIGHGGGSAGYFLSASKLSVEWSEVQRLDLTQLAADAERERWDERIAAALAFVDLTPTSPVGWHLAAYYG